METLTVALSEDMFISLRDPCVSVRGLVAAIGLIRSPVCKTRIADPLASIVEVRDRRLTRLVRPTAIESRARSVAVTSGWPLVRTDRRPGETKAAVAETGFQSRCVRFRATQVRQEPLCISIGERPDWVQTPRMHMESRQGGHLSNVGYSTAGAHGRPAPHSRFRQALATRCVIVSEGLVTAWASLRDSLSRNQAGRSQT